MITPLAFGLETTLLDRISAALMSLSPAEQRVGQLVLSDPLVFSRLPAHRDFWPGQLGHRGAGRAAQILSPGHSDDRLRRQPHAAHERYCPMVSRLLHLMILDIVATSVALRIGIGELRPGLRQMQSCLLEKRGC